VEGDLEMEVEEPSPAKDGDISPINRSISNLAEESNTSTAKVAKRPEPTFEIRPNFSRVTPAQLAHISFPPEGRYQPVRPVSATTISRATPAGPLTTVTSEKFAGGGGILILADLRPEEEGEFIEFEPPVEPEAPGTTTSVPNGNAISAPLSGPQFALDDSATEGSPPESFEVRSCIYSPMERC
jgi:26S proteasome regulatory subunit N2